ncbi:hypothetical protein [Thermococcus sp. M39]|uniref:hypothetical protein n=1 Tax=Thermococcus sp. M39 TaxID=1638262 RepID=UPI001438C4FB|nr:hypothetical protein [Thermococcus sp. M39]
MCDVEKLISIGENEEIEFKENFDFNGIMETVICRSPSLRKSLEDFRSHFIRIFTLKSI